MSVPGPAPTAALKVLVLHGPNLNLLGEREPEVYGRTTLAEIDERIAARARELGIEPRSAQSNSEAELIDRIQDARGWADAILINPAGYSHTSVAIRDAIAAGGVPAIVVHLSNPAAREDFRRSDIVATAARAVVAGFGWRSYLMALDAVPHLVTGAVP